MMDLNEFAGPVAAIHRAISDPGSVLPRLSGEWGLEPLPEWQTRAVLAVLPEDVTR